MTYATVVDAYVRAGQLARAGETLGAAAAVGVALDAWSWSSLVKGHVLDGNLQVRLHAGSRPQPGAAAAGAAARSWRPVRVITGATCKCVQRPSACVRPPSKGSLP